MTWLDECTRDAKALPQEKRQEFLDLLWSGKTLGEAQATAGISFQAANGILRQNIEHNLEARELSLSRRAV